jgi:hypothetical protein
MEKPTCPDELPNEIVSVDIMNENLTCEPPPSSFNHGLALATKYLQSSIKASTLSQVIELSIKSFRRNKFIVSFKCNLLKK